MKIGIVNKSPDKREIKVARVYILVKYRNVFISDFRPSLTALVYLFAMYC